MIQRADVEQGGGLSEAPHVSGTKAQNGFGHLPPVRTSGVLPALVSVQANGDSHQSCNV